MLVKALSEVRMGFVLTSFCVQRFIDSRDLLQVLLCRSVFKMVSGHMYEVPHVLRFRTVCHFFCLRMQMHEASVNLQKKTL